MLSLLWNFFFLTKTSNTSSQSIQPNNNAINSQLDLKNVSQNNSLEQYIANFRKIQNFQDFEKWSGTYWTEYAPAIFIKFWTKNDYKAFFDYYFQVMEQRDASFVKQMQSNWWKSAYDKQVESLYNEIKQGITQISDNDYEIDYKIYYNNLELKSALSNCDALRKKFPDFYKNDNNMCENKIYFFRANKDNNLCDKMTDLSGKSLCIASLGYPNN